VSDRPGRDADQRGDEDHCAGAEGGEDGKTARLPERTPVLDVVQAVEGVHQGDDAAGGRPDGANESYREQPHAPALVEVADLLGDDSTGIRGGHVADLADELLDLLWLKNHARQRHEEKQEREQRQHAEERDRPRDVHQLVLDEPFLQSEEEFLPGHSMSWREHLRPSATIPSTSIWSVSPEAALQGGPALAGLPGCQGNGTSRG